MEYALVNWEYFKIFGVDHEAFDAAEQVFRYHEDVLVSHDPMEFWYAL